MRACVCVCPRAREFMSEAVCVCVCVCGKVGERALLLGGGWGEPLCVGGGGGGGEWLCCVCVCVCVCCACWRVCVEGRGGARLLACLLSNAKDSRNMPLFFNARILRQRKITDMMKLDLRLVFIGRGSAVRSHSHSLGVYAPACGGASRTPRPSPQCDVKDLF